MVRRRSVPAVVPRDALRSAPVRPARWGLLLWCVLLGAAPVSSAQPRARATAPPIRLILLIAVDQVRYDYLTRFRSEFTDGLDRLLTTGAVFTNATLDHYPSVTAVGHSTMLTGATPSRSGIIGNDWFDRATDRQVTSVSDPGQREVQGDSETSASPHRLLAETVGDVLQRTMPDSRVIGMSLKDRSAILMAGREADAAYWFDETIGRFVSSTYYFPDAPAWVQAFNDQRIPDRYARQSWTPIGTDATRRLPSRRGAELYAAVESTPFGNSLLRAFAEEALREEALGQRGVTDLLAVGFSSNDTIGHAFGPDSPEVHDVTVRTDAIVGRLLAVVDELVGLDRTLVILTSDHGVSPLPETLAEQGEPGGRMTTLELMGPIQRALEAEFGAGRWLRSTAGSSPYLNYALIQERGLTRPQVREVAARAAAGAPHVARVYTRDQLEHGEVGEDAIDRRVLHGFHAGRSGDLEILLDPNWMRLARGTTHGTPYDYDVHIPLVLMGPGVRPGTYDEPVVLNDLSPTVSALAGIPAPSQATGRVLTEALTTGP